MSSSLRSLNLAQVGAEATWTCLLGLLADLGSCRSAACWPATVESMIGSNCSTPSGEEKLLPLATVTRPDLRFRFGFWALDESRRVSFLDAIDFEAAS